MPEKTVTPVTPVTPPTTTTPASETPAPEPVVFEDWIKAQDATIVAAYTEHTTGLQNAVKATRQERDDFAKQIKDLTGKAAKGSELEASLKDLSDKLEKSERRATFAEDAIKPEIGCSNPKAAFAIAQADGLFSKSGAPDWTAIKAAAPELFVKKPPTPSGDGGEGSRTTPTTAKTMDDRIRASAGVGR
jgi:hypothetical protein